MNGASKLVPLQPQTFSTALARHLCAAVRARLKSLRWDELLIIPFDARILVVQGLHAESCPTIEDVIVRRVRGAAPWDGHKYILQRHEHLASFSFALNDLRATGEPEEEDLAQHSPRLVRYVEMTSSDMADFLTCYASYIIEDYCLELVDSQGR